MWKSNCILGERTLRVKRHNSKNFCDNKKKKNPNLKNKNKKKKTFKLNKQIGFLAHIKQNIFILGLKRELRIINIKTKKIIYSLALEKNLPENRINDGKTEPKGRLWIGTMENRERKIKTGS